MARAERPERGYNGCRTGPPSDAFNAFAAHDGFRPEFCEAAGPESKGRVEALVGYAKRDLVVPGAPWPDLVTANVAAASWCAEVNGQRHSEIAEPSSPTTAPGVTRRAHAARARWLAGSFGKVRSSSGAPSPSTAQAASVASCSRRASRSARCYPALPPGADPDPTVRQERSGLRPRDRPGDRPGDGAAPGPGGWPHSGDRAAR